MVVEMVPLKGGIGSIYSPNWQYIPLIYHLYIAFWGVICYLPALYRNLKNPLILHFQSLTVRPRRLDDHFFERIVESSFLLFRHCARG